MTHIYKTLSTSDISCALMRDEYAGWSLEAADALAEYIENLAYETGEAIELDTVALRCDWDTNTADQVAADYDYDIDVSDCEDSDERYEVVIEYLRNNTTVIELSNGELLYQAF